MSQNECGAPEICGPISVRLTDSTINDREAADCVLRAMRDGVYGRHDLLFVNEDPGEEFVLALTTQTMSDRTAILTYDDSHAGCDGRDVYEVWEPLLSPDFFDECLALSDAELAQSSCLIGPTDFEACEPTEGTFVCG